MSVPTEEPQQKEPLYEEIPVSRLYGSYKSLKVWKDFANIPIEPNTTETFYTLKSSSMSDLRNFTLLGIEGISSVTFSINGVNYWNFNNVHGSDVIHMPIFQNESPLLFSIIRHFCVCRFTFCNSKSSEDRTVSLMYEQVYGIHNDTQPAHLNAELASLHFVDYIPKVIDGNVEKMKMQYSGGAVGLSSYDAKLNESLFVKKNTYSIPITYKVTEPCEKGSVNVIATENIILQIQKTSWKSQVRVSNLIGLTNPPLVTVCSDTSDKMDEFLKELHNTIDKTLFRVTSYRTQTVVNHEKTDALRRKLRGYLDEAYEGFVIEEKVLNLDDIVECSQDLQYLGEFRACAEVQNLLAKNSGWKVMK
jgi:hypothetical protein